jgi:hypothetical protein
MDSSQQSPLFDLFRRGGLPQEVRLAAARGELELPAREQLALLASLSGDQDPQVAELAAATIDAIPRGALGRVLGLPDTAPDLRRFYDARGFTTQDSVAAPGTAAGSSGSEEPLFRAADIAPEPAPGEAEPPPDPEAGAADGQEKPVPLSMRSVIERIKAAMRGSREQRAVLVRDPNRLVTAAVLSSPRLTDQEVESFARMGSVSEDVLRTIGSQRRWLKNYTVMAALVKNPRTPPGISMPLVSRLSERDLKLLALDRNLPEGVRIGARKQLQASQSRRQ